VNWYFKQFVSGNAMEYGYTQAGQENSFTWDAMAKGFEIQMPLISRLRDAHQIKVETLAASGEWFRRQYKTTPATAVTVNQDIAGSDRKTVWFNSRFYRLNLLWEKGTLRFRDIHLFNEDFPSVYTSGKATSNECSFFTLPFVDGFLWSAPGLFAGLRFKALVDGKEILLEGNDPVITNAVPGVLHIEWPLKTFQQILTMDIDERQIKIDIPGASPIKWFLDLTAAPAAQLPFKNIDSQQAQCEFEKMIYQVNAIKGNFSKPNDSTVLRITPEKNLIQLDLSGHSKD
jgi:hypothetical protein